MSSAEHENDKKLNTFPIFKIIFPIFCSKTKSNDMPKLLIRSSNRRVTNYMSSFNKLHLITSRNELLNIKLLIVSIVSFTN